ncbi:MAG: nuclear transport factor 2 family protein [Crocinitomix sp.]|nr:nuclear transport factor 2 family protein [Crocinitomix sp.]
MEEVIKEFYTAFQQKDVEKMVACYHDEVVFEDPAFGKLTGDHAKNMWRMLLSNNTNLKVEFSIPDLEPKNEANWEAFYVFSKTNRPVHNKIHAKFEFLEGKISKHTDHFNLKVWAKQALGFKGGLIGGTNFFKRKLNQQTNQLLTRFEKKLNE